MCTSRRCRRAPFRSPPSPPSAAVGPCFVGPVRPQSARSMETSRSSLDGPDEAVPGAVPGACTERCGQPVQVILFVFDLQFTKHPCRVTCYNVHGPLKACSVDLQSIFEFTARHRQEGATNALADEGSDDDQHQTEDLSDCPGARENADAGGREARKMAESND